MQQTEIAWATHTWNPITGCSKTSPGCANCYAQKMATRLRGRCGYPADAPFAPTFHEDRLEEPQRIKRSSRIFVCSMGDLFHENMPFENVVRVFDVMCDPAMAKHTFMILTKRPARMLKFVDWVKTWHWTKTQDVLANMRVFANIWAGVTIENEASVHRAG